MEKFEKEDTLIIKGLAIVIMIAHHLFGRSQAAWAFFDYYPSLMIDGKPLITALVSAGCGKVCVDIFVILSGFGLNESFRNKYGNTTKLGVSAKYCAGKILKLLMGFWCVFLVFGGIFTLAGKIDPVGIYGTGSAGVKNFIIDFLGLRDLLFEVTGGGTLNATWWYMSAILVFYLLFPLFRLLVKSRYRVLAFLALLLINIDAPSAAYRQFSTGIFFYLSAFYLGMLCSEWNLFDKLKSLGKEHYHERLLCSIAAVILAHRFTYTDRYRGELVLAAALFVMYFALFIEPGAVLHKNWSRKILAVLGKHSGNIFMFHTFFLLKCQNFTYYLRNPLLILLHFILSMTLISMVFEFVKTKLGYYRLEKKLSGLF